MIFVLIIDIVIFVDIPSLHEKFVYLVLRRNMDFCPLAMYFSVQQDNIYVINPFCTMIFYFMENSGLGNGNATHFLLLLFFFLFTFFFFPLLPCVCSINRNIVVLE